MNLWLKSIERINKIVAALLVIVCLAVNLNGEVFGLNGRQSFCVGAGIVTAGMICTTVLIANKRWSVFLVLSSLLYIGVLYQLIRYRIS